MSARRHRMTVAYDGTSYAGWQVQPGRPTVQGELERALKRVSGEDIKAHGSGRTDRGVHAAGQVAHFDMEKRIDPRDIMRALNAVLPPDIRVTDVRRAPGDFHARRGASGKEYRYFIWNGAALPPWRRNFYAHERRELDVELMNEACRMLAGRRDFSAFAANPNRRVESAVRTLYRLDARRKGREVAIIAEGDGFLYKMVRSLAGFLIRVGAGDLRPSDAERILKSGMRTAEVPTADARGLFLWRVKYGRRKEKK